MVFSAKPLWCQQNELVVRSLSFRGNKAIPDDSLRRLIATTASSYFARAWWLKWLGLGEKRRFSERTFRVDIEGLGVVYRASGYLGVRIDTTVRRTPRDVYITIAITEGTPIILRRLTVVGLDSVRNREDFLRGLPLRVGKPKNMLLAFATKDTIARRLHDRGYPNASVEVSSGPRFPKDSPDIELVVSTGRLSTVGPITVTGTTQVDTQFVRSLLTTKTGKVFRVSEIEQSQINLLQTELFRYALVKVGGDTMPSLASDTAIPLTVLLEDGNFHRVRAQLGVGTNDCIRSLAGWTARNVSSEGRRLEFVGQVSKLGVKTDPFKSTVCNGLEEDSIGSRKINFGLSASYRRPVFLSPQNALTISAFAERRSEFKVYLRDEYGFGLGFSRQSSRYPINVNYRLAYGRTEASPVSFCAFFLACRADDIDRLLKRRLSATLTGATSRQWVDRPFDPTRGAEVGLEATISSPLIGSNRFDQFTRFVGEAVVYRSLGRSVVLAGKVKGGVIFAPRLRLAAGEANFVPPEQRFYAGGANDVRGFDRNELGPLVYVTPASNIGSQGEVIFHDSVQVAPIGGNTMAIGNLELRLPSPIIASRLRWVAFVDAGAVWERGSGFSTRPNLAVTPGVGFRFRTLLGPFRVDLAYNGSDRPRGALYAAGPTSLLLIRNDYRKPRERSFNLQVSIGQAF